MRRSSTAVATLIADLSSQGSVRRLAAEVLARYPKLDVLVNNAGAMYGTRQLTKDGIELTWAVNHLAPFLLSKLLLHRLKESAPARIIAAASQAHYRAHIPFDDLKAERSYRGFGGYCETKLANLLFTTELARRLDGTGVTANCFHPGLVATGFNNNGLLMNLGMTILRPQHGCRARSLLRDRANVRRTAVLFQLRIHDRFPPCGSAASQKNLPSLHARSSDVFVHSTTDFLEGSRARGMHLRRVLALYSSYYNQTRTHLALGKDAPLRRAVQASGPIIATPVLFGLHHRYARI
jgi:NAD(P)-dependent dehydrogenase (short-subunit alcohol dehydrogenase family)